MSLLSAKPPYKTPMKMMVAVVRLANDGRTTP